MPKISKADKRLDSLRRRKRIPRCEFLIVDGVMRKGFTKNVAV